MPTTLFHYTDAKGYAGIMRDMAIIASTAERRPSDVRHGDGVYLTDIAPGTCRPGQLLVHLIRRPFPVSRVAFFVEISTAGLDVVYGKDHVYAIPGRDDLEIRDRLVSHGPTPRPNP